MIFVDHTKGGFILSDQPSMKDLLAAGLDEQGAESVLEFLERAKWREIRDDKKSNPDTSEESAALIDSEDAP